MRRRKNFFIHSWYVLKKSKYFLVESFSHSHNRNVSRHVLPINIFLGCEYFRRPTQEAKTQIPDRLTVFHHYGQKLYYNLRGRSQKNLPLSSSFSITYGVESVAQNIDSHHVEPWYMKHTDVNKSFKTIAKKLSLLGTR